MSTGMILDGILGSQCVDSSGEVLDILGADCSDWEKGTLLCNWEHEPGENGADTIVGKVIYLKKIFKEDDCENERQEMYFKKINKIPMIYGVIRLFDGSGHENAKAIAAIIRDSVANNEPIVCRYSVEGSTVSRHENILKESIIRKLAITVKPANKTAYSGLIEDPDAPAGFEKVHVKEKVKDLLEDAIKFENPMYTKLGGSTEIECNPIIDEEQLNKAMIAGSYDAAPSTLTGGAALQKEDSGLKNQALAALRDFKKKTFKKEEFREFAKHRLPEASDSFLDHFTNIAEDYHIKRDQLRKDEEKGLSVKPPEIKLDVDKPEKAPKGIVEEKKPKAAEIPATIRGVSIAQNKHLDKPVFDEEKGILHAPFGSFPLHKPDAEHFNRILSDPKVEQFHNKAMENWVKVNKLLKAHKLPEEVIMHAALFSQLSPNTPVPMQELMQGHLIDAMKETGADPREPGFSDKVKENWIKRDNPNKVPEHSKDFFESNAGIRLKNESKTNGRQPGEIGAFMIPNNKMENMDKYHLLHNSLVDLVNKHGADARSAVTELINHKKKGFLWEEKRKRDKESGKSDIGAYPGPLGDGLAPKTARYMLGMLGGGNVFVPDTHMVRHLTGLEQRKDPETIKPLRDLMWNENNTHILDGIDRWYAKNHPAVQHMMNHPLWKQHFEKPEDAIFPAFWKHWVGIAPDERMRGMYNQNYIEGTTHEPFWDAISPFVDGKLNKSDEEGSIAHKTAKIHAQYVKDYGEIPASMMYYHHLVPHLLDAAEFREKQGSLSNLAKKLQLDILDIKLRKSLEEIHKHPKLMDPEMPEVHKVHVKIGDKHHPAGRFIIANGNLSHLEDYHGLLERFLPEGPVTEKTVSRIHGLKSSPHLSIEKDEVPPAPMENPPVMDETPKMAQAEELLKNPIGIPKPPSVFNYHRVGMDKPHTLEVNNGIYMLDGSPLSTEEIKTIKDNIDKNLATIRYKTSKVADQIKKMQDYFIDLVKAETMDPASALTAVRAAVAAGHVHPDVERALTQHIYKDPMTPLGNKYAFNEFMAKKKPGAYVSLDLNDMKAINDTLGHEAGDHAIKAYGNAIHDAIGESVGQEHAKSFMNPDDEKGWRSGGDEAVVHLPSHEHAAKFARALSQKLQAIPPIHGLHQMSASVGIGHNYETADKALYEAKKQKMTPGTKNRAFPVGNVPNLAHSLFPGHEGAIPIHNPTATAVSHTLTAPSSPGVIAPKAA